MKKTVFFLLIFIVCVSAVYSQDNESIWRMMNEGILAVDSGELGKAAYIFREILKNDKNNPEALKWLGYLFEAEGEYNLAVRQYEKALAYSNRLTIVEDRYYIMYRLAELYSKNGNQKDYVKMLEKIINDTPSEKNSDQEITAMVKLFESRGIDKFFELYRPETRVTLDAHRLLSEEYLKNKEYSKSLRHLVFALGTPVTYVIEEQKKIDPDYTFKGNNKTGDMERLIQLTEKNKRFKAYFNDVHFFECLLTAGIDLAKSGYRESGIYILTLVYNYAHDIALRNRAARYSIEN